MNVSSFSKADILLGIDGADERFFVAELSTGYLALSHRRQYFPGYCFFYCKVPARELHELPTDVRLRHLLEMSIVTEAVNSAFKPKKMNVAFFGNAWPQVHWNIIPRYGDDPLPEDAIWCIDRAVLESVTPSDNDISRRRSALREVLPALAVRDGIPISFDWERELASSTSDARACQS